MYVPHKKGPRHQFFRDFRIVYRNGDISQSHAANHHRLQSRVTLCLTDCSK